MPHGDGRRGYIFEGSVPRAFNRLGQGRPHKMGGP